MRRIFSLFLCACFILEQPACAQVVNQLDLPAFTAGAAQLSQQRFRPLHLRYICPRQKDLGLLFDKGDQGHSDPEMTAAAKRTMDYFLTGVSMPSDRFWVNLRPDSPERMLDRDLEQTELGRVLLEADLQLKKDTAALTSPATKQGRQYWDRLYKRAEEIYGSEAVNIPTVTRPWIVPGEIIIRKAAGSAYIYKATLKVLLEQDYLKGSAEYSFSDKRQQELNKYSSELLRELVIPSITREVNSGRKYAALRQVYYALILAKWFKDACAGKGIIYASLIDSRDRAGLASSSWSKQDYFNDYRHSFASGEYNIREVSSTASGQTVRTYFSGGCALTSFGEAETAGIRISPAVDTLPAQLLSAGQLARLDGGGITFTDNQLYRKADGGEALKARVGMLGEKYTVLASNTELLAALAGFQLARESEMGAALPGRRQIETAAEMVRTAAGDKQLLRQMLAEGAASDQLLKDVLEAALVVVCSRIGFLKNDSLFFASQRDKVIKAAFNINSGLMNSGYEANRRMISELLERDASHVLFQIFFHEIGHNILDSKYDAELWRFLEDEAFLKEPFRDFRRFCEFFADAVMYRVSADLSIETDSIEAFFHRGMLINDFKSVHAAPRFLVQTRLRDRLKEEGSLEALMAGVQHVLPQAGGLAEERELVFDFGRRFQATAESGGNVKALIKNHQRAIDSLLDALSEFNFVWDVSRYLGWVEDKSWESVEDGIRQQYRAWQASIRRSGRERARADGGEKSLIVPALDESMPSVMAGIREKMGRLGDVKDNARAAVFNKELLDLAVNNRAEFDRALNGKWGELLDGTQGKMTALHIMQFLMSLSENEGYRAMSSREQALLEWIALLHDIGKRAAIGPLGEYVSDPAHAFKSAIIAVDLLPGLGFAPAIADPAEFEKAKAGWIRMVRGAIVNRGGVEYQANSGIEGIVAGIDTLFGAGSPGSLILKAVLLHKSFYAIRPEENGSLLTPDHLRSFFAQDRSSFGLFAQAIIADTLAWNLFGNKKDMMRAAIQASLWQKADIIGAGKEFLGTSEEAAGLREVYSLAEVKREIDRLPQGSGYALYLDIDRTVLETKSPALGGREALYFSLARHGFVAWRRNELHKELAAQIEEQRLRLSPEDFAEWQRKLETAIMRTVMEEAMVMEEEALRDGLYQPVEGTSALIAAARAKGIPVIAVTNRSPGLRHVTERIFAGLNIDIAGKDILFCGFPNESKGIHIARHVRENGIKGICFADDENNNILDVFEKTRQAGVPETLCHIIIQQEVPDQDEKEIVSRMVEGTRYETFIQGRLNGKGAVTVMRRMQTQAGATLKDGGDLIANISKADVRMLLDLATRVESLDHVDVLRYKVTDRDNGRHSATVLLDHRNDRLTIEDANGGRESWPIHFAAPFGYSGIFEHPHMLATLDLKTGADTTENLKDILAVRYGIRNATIGKYYEFGFWVVENALGMRSITFVPEEHEIETDIPRNVASTGITEASGAAVLREQIESSGKRIVAEGHYHPPVARDSYMVSVPDILAMLGRLDPVNGTTKVTEFILSPVNKEAAVTRVEDDKSGRENTTVTEVYVTAHTIDLFPMLARLKNSGFLKKGTLAELQGKLGQYSFPPREVFAAMSLEQFRVEGAELKRLPMPVERLNSRGAVEFLGSDLLKEIYGQLQGTQIDVSVKREKTLIHSRISVTGTADTGEAFGFDLILSDNDWKTFSLGKVSLHPALGDKQYGELVKRILVYMQARGFSKAHVMAQEEGREEYWKSLGIGGSGREKPIQFLLDSMKENEKSAVHWTMFDGGLIDSLKGSVLTEAAQNQLLAHMIFYAFRTGETGDTKELDWQAMRFKRSSGPEIPAQELQRLIAIGKEHRSEQAAVVHREEGILWQGKEGSPQEKAVLEVISFRDWVLIRAGVPAENNEDFGDPWGASLKDGGDVIDQVLAGFGIRRREGKLRSEADDGKTRFVPEHGTSFTVNDRLATFFVNNCIVVTLWEAGSRIGVMTHLSVVTDADRTLSSVLSRFDPKTVSATIVIGGNADPGLLAEICGRLKGISTIGFVRISGDALAFDASKDEIVELANVKEDPERFASLGRAGDVRDLEKKSPAYYVGPDGLPREPAGAFLADGGEDFLRGDTLSDPAKDKLLAHMIFYAFRTGGTGDTKELDWQTMRLKRSSGPEIPAQELKRLIAIGKEHRSEQAAVVHREEGILWQGKEGSPQEKAVLEVISFRDWVLIRAGVPAENNEDFGDPWGAPLKDGGHAFLATLKKQMEQKKNQCGYSIVAKDSPETVRTDGVATCSAIALVADAPDEGEQLRLVIHVFQSPARSHAQGPLARESYEIAAQLPDRLAEAGFQNIQMFVLYDASSHSGTYMDEEYLAEALRGKVRSLELATRIGDTVASVSVSGKAVTIARKGRNGYREIDNATDHPWALSPVLPAPSEAAADGGANRMGGIDLRALPSMPKTVKAVSGSGAADIKDLGAEWARIERLANRQMIPSAERIRQFVLCCKERGELGAYAGQVLACVARILQLEEEKAESTETALKDVLILLEA